MKHIFVINPVAGKGKAITELLPQIIKTVKESGVEYEIHRTLNAGDACRYVKSKCEEINSTAQKSRKKNGIDKVRFYSCGGDGTMNEVLNGLYGYPYAELTVIPAGTGNDFIRNFRNPESFSDIEKQINGEAQPIDAIRYELLESKEDEKIAESGYALNMFNMGFDAQVVSKAAEIKKKPLMGGTTAYIGGVGVVLAKLKKLALSVEVDGESLFDELFLLAGVANGRFSGGGFDGMPKARIYDGHMDLLLVKSVTRRFFLSIVKKYHDGTHMDDPRLDGILFHYPCKEVIIRPAESMIIAIDGEVSTVGGIKFTVCPGSINFSLPQH